MAGKFQPGPLFSLLTGGGVDFVVIGGFAALAHGSAQLTFDVDIVYAQDQENLERLGRVLVDLEARLRGVAEVVPFTPDARTLRQAQVLTLETAFGDLDLLTSPSGSPGFEALSERALLVDWKGLQIKVASVEDLIAMKRAAGRPKDLLAVEELEAIQRITRESAGLDHPSR